MATDVSKVHIGPGELYATSDLTAAPTKGGTYTDPTTSSIMTMTAGLALPATSANPAWRHIGFTQGSATLTYRPTYYMVESEQAFGEILTVPTNEESTLAAIMLEADYRNLALAAGQATTEVNAGLPVNDALFVGGKQSVGLNVIVLCSRKRVAGYFVLTLYQAYSSEGISLPFARREESRIPVTFRCVPDVTRPIGDQLFQLASYTVTP
jgi:hypothetical protein